MRLKEQLGRKSLQAAVAEISDLASFNWNTETLKLQKIVS